MTTQWQATDVSDAKYLGPLEFKDSNGDWHDFEILQTNSRLVFGGACNVGFLESGYIEREEYESVDEITRRNAGRLGNLL